jgi:hypothetical protein
VNKIILNWQRPLWEGDKEVAKRSGRDEPMWVAIYKCTEVMPGISLYSYLTSNQQKRYVFLIISYVFSTTKSETRVQQVLLRSRGWRDGRGGTRGGTINVYT